jgi:hypothetical protein
MTEPKDKSTEFIRSHDVNTVKRIANHGEEPYRSMAQILLEVAEVK